MATSTRTAPRRSAQRTRLWGLLLALPTAWMVTFFVSSMVIVVLLSFGTTTSDGFPVFGTTTDNFAALWDGVYLRLFLRSLLYALATVVLSALIAYPVAYAIALHGGRYKNVLIAAIVVPVYASLERMDVSLIEAGKDLYHSPLRTFLTVTLPATRAGLYGGMLLVFLPALGDFVSAQLLGGSSTFMVGNLVQQQFVEGQNWPLGSAMTVTMMAALTLLVVVYLRGTATRVREL